MGKLGIGVAVAGVALALAGCTTAPETRVTRFHLGQPLARGQLSVEPMAAGRRDSIEFQTYAGIIGAELARLGFTEAPGLASSEQVAVFDVERNTVAAPRRSGLTLGLGGGSYGWNGGVGGGVSIPVGGNKANLVTATRLVVQIKRRSEGTVVWEGRGETAAPANSPQAQPAEAVRRLAAALFQGFPGESGRTITLK